MPDRVEFSFAWRVQAREYEPIEARASLASDLQPGETVDQAFARISTEVLKQCVTRLKLALELVKHGP